MRAYGCLSLCVSPPSGWQPVQGVPRCGMVAGIGSSHDPDEDKRKRMNAWMDR